MYKDHPGMWSGDDYTFWKDIMEIPVVLLSVAACLPALAGVFPAGYVFLYLTLFLATLELYFAFQMAAKLPDPLFLAFMMFVRAYARAAGFVAGLAFLLLGKSAKKVN